MKITKNKNFDLRLYIEIFYDELDLISQSKCKFHNTAYLYKGVKFVYCQHSLMRPNQRTMSLFFIFSCEALNNYNDI